MRETYYLNGLSVHDYAEGHALFNRETRGVGWGDVNSQTKEAWARRAREERRESTFVVVGVAGGTQEIRAANMYEALNKAGLISSSVLSITRVP